MSAAPIPMRYEGDGEFRAASRHAGLCDRLFVVGETYPLAVHEDRSWNSHRHYFAAIKDAWENLPEDQAERFPSPEHLRKYCLVRAGYSNSQTVVCESAAEARRFISLAKSLDEFCVVTIREKVATVFTAKSQSVKAMGAREFQDSKRKVLDECARLIGVEPSALAANAARAA